MKSRRAWYSTLTMFMMIGELGGRPANMSVDYSVKDYITEKVCWWNEKCKEEFHGIFNCRCPEWLYCRGPGRYYNAFCSLMGSGYIWSQKPFNLLNDTIVAAQTRNTRV